MAFHAAVLAALLDGKTFGRGGQADRLSVVSPANDLALRIDVRFDEAVVEIGLLRYTTVGIDVEECVRHALDAVGGGLQVSALVERVVAGTGLFRRAFPQRRRARASRL